MNKAEFILTGGNGWLGQRVARAIINNIDEATEMKGLKKTVRCLVPPGENTKFLENLGVNIVYGRLENHKSIDQLMADSEGGTIIHMAGIIHPKMFTSLFQKINVDGTKIILNAAKKFGAKKLIAISSNSPFGENVIPDSLFSEESPYSPYMEYGRSKMEMEKILKNHIKSGLNPEISILRVPWFYGPGQPARQTQFFSMIKSGTFPLIGDGRNLRSMGYVDNLAEAVLLAATKTESKNETFWIADEYPYKMIEIVSTVKEVLRDDFGIPVNPRQLYLPSYISKVARISDTALQSIGLYSQKIHVLSEMNMSIACSIEKSKNILGYHPKISLREGMQLSIEWCLNNKQII